MAKKSAALEATEAAGDGRRRGFFRDGTSGRTVVAVVTNKNADGTVDIEYPHPTAEGSIATATAPLGGSVWQYSDASDEELAEEGRLQSEANAQAIASSERATAAELTRMEEADGAKVQVEATQTREPAAPPLPLAVQE